MGSQDKLALEVPKTFTHAINRLKHLTGALSGAEVIGKAVALYEFVWEVKTKGKEKIVIRDEIGNERELNLK